MVFALKEYIRRASTCDLGGLEQIKIAGLHTHVRPWALGIIANSPLKNSLSPSPDRKLVHIGAGLCANGITRFLKDLGQLCVATASGHVGKPFRLEGEMCLLAPHWIEPEARTGDHPLYDRALGKVIGAKAFAGRCFFYRLNDQGQTKSILCGVREDPKYGLELEFSFAGGFDGRLSMLSNLANEVWQETQLRLNTFAAELQAIGVFETRKPCQAGLSHQVHHLFHARIDDAVMPKITQEMVGFVEFSPEQILDHLRHPEKPIFIKLGKDTEARQAKFKFEVPAALAFLLARHAQSGLLPRGIMGPDSPDEILSLLSKPHAAMGTGPHPPRGFRKFFANKRQADI
jgi:hypothetical protein